MLSFRFWETYIFLLIKNKWLLTLEGGHINKESGESINDNTYVIIDCDGIKELALKGNIQISRDILSPVEQNGKLLPLPNRVRGDFAIKASDWNDLLVKVSITPLPLLLKLKIKTKDILLFMQVKLFSTLVIYEMILMSFSLNIMLHMDTLLLVLNHGVGFI